MCLIIDGEKVLLGEGYDKVRKKHFYRVLGGGMEFGETAEQAVRREIKEELNSEIENLKFLKALENIFTYEGMNGHEITFMFKGELKDKSLLREDSIFIDEGDYSFDAKWVPVSDILEKKITLYPSCDYKKLLNL